MLAKLTSKNQLTLPKSVVLSVGKAVLPRQFFSTDRAPWISILRM